MSIFNKLPIPRSGGGTTIAPKPFDILIGAPISENSSTLKVTVVPGAFASNVIPTNMYSQDFKIQKTGTFIAKIKVLTNGGSITSSTIEIDANQPPNQKAVANSMPTTFYIVFAVIRDAIPYRVLGDAGPSVSGTLLFTTMRADAQPNELLYDAWYVWKVDL